MERTIQVNPTPFRTKGLLDKGSSIFHLIMALLSSSSLVVIAVFLLYKGLAPFFTTYTIDGSPFNINVGSFLFGLSWYGFPSESGILYLVINTLWIALLSIIVALPLGTLLALFITQIAPKWLGDCLSFVVEILSAIPSVVYGLFGRGFITSVVSSLALVFGVTTKGGLSLLSGTLVLAIMILPIITSLSANSMRSVPKDLIEASLALGASKEETNFKIVIRHASNGIYAGCVLGIGRAIGEATAISLVIGNAGTGPTFSLFDTTATLTSVMLLGYSDSEGVNQDIRFSLGLALILLLIGINALMSLLKKAKEKHEGF